VKGPSHGIPRGHSQGVSSRLVGGTPPHGTLRGPRIYQRARRDHKISMAHPQQLPPEPRISRPTNQLRERGSCEEGDSPQIYSPQRTHRSGRSVKQTSRRSIAQAGKARYEHQTSRTYMDRSTNTSRLNDLKCPQKSASCRRTKEGVVHHAGESKQNVPFLVPGSRSLINRHSVQRARVAGKR
jgi:hypothetical protein